MRQRLTTVLTFFVLLSSSILFADEKTEPTAEYKPPGRVSSTTISFELLTGARGQSFAARQWYDLFSELKVPLRIRQSVRKEKPAVTETIQGGVRKIHVVGVINTRGNMVVPQAKFSSTQKEKLVEWVNDLREYGSLGDPEGKPVWGLSKPQYEYVLRELSVPIGKKLQGENFTDGLLKFNFPKGLALSLTESTKQHLRKVNVHDRKFPDNLGSTSLGSALAMFVRQYDLGFVPTRLPNGQIVLTLGLLDELEKPWPIGWDWTNRPHLTAPQFFKTSEFRIKEYTLYEFANMIKTGAELDIAFDYYNFRAINADLNEIKITIRPQKTAWNLLLKKGLASAHLKAERRVDEAGKPFLWIGPSQQLIRLQKKKLLEEAQPTESQPAKTSN